jgi:hypothetical protein
MRARSFLAALGAACLALAGLVPPTAHPGQDPSKNFRLPGQPPAGQTPTAPPGGAQRLQPNMPAARPRDAREIWLYDNFYGPPMTLVKPGTRIRWVNQGLHHHTVTSTDGLWDSGALSRGGDFSYTFTRPGTYTYYCRFHPFQMYGTVIVAD